MATQVPSGGLTPVEQSLVEHVCRGEWLDLIPKIRRGKTVDENTMRSWGDSRICRASVIRKILRGQLAADPDPHGLRFRGARISGRLDLDNLTTDVNLELEDCLLEEGVLARDAHLASVSLAGCQLEHPAGCQLECPADSPLDAARLTCSMLSLRRARIIGHTEAGALSLVCAHIGGQLSCHGASVCNDSGPALTAYGLQTGEDVSLWDGFTATGARARTVVDLRGARVGGTLQFHPKRLEHAKDARCRLAVDGLTYTGVPKTGPPWDWLDLLRDGTPEYAAQPYQRLAAGYRALGKDRQARKTLIRQRDDELARTGPGLWRWLWGKTTKVTLGYGYKPWRALWGLFAVVGVSCVLAVVLGAQGALAQTAAPHRPCTMIQRVSVGLDLNLPVGTSLARADCGLPKDPKDAASAAATSLVIVGWVLRVAAWVFAALFIAGFTSAVRKT